MDSSSLKSWRKAQRERLIAERLAIPDATLEAWRERMDGFLERSFPGLAGRRVAFCWPIKKEYDARHYARTLRERGSLTALPVVVAPRSPLAFREWHPGVRLAKGALDIPYPVDSAQIVPEAVLLPMNGWDPQGYRLGYGAGFFDRTLAAEAMHRAGVTAAQPDAVTPAGRHAAITSASRGRSPPDRAAQRYAPANDASVKIPRK